MFPSAIKRRLERSNWYLRFRYSPIVLRLWLMLRPSVRKQLDQQRNLYLTLLKEISSPSRVIFDIGANEGFLTQIFLDAGYRVIAVEPDHTNFRILTQRFRNNPAVTCVQAAVSDQNGIAQFNTSKKGSAFGTLSEKWKKIREAGNANSYAETSRTIPSVTLDHLIETHGTPGFIKIDVEGYEEAVLRGLSSRVNLISFEAILPQFIDETIRSIKRISSINADALFNFALSDRLVYGEFKPADELKDGIDKLPACTVEIFVCLG